MPKKKKDLEIIFSPEAQASIDRAIAKDPSLGDSLRDMFAAMRQAHQAVETGQYDNFADAMEAITGERPTPVEDDPEFLEMLEASERDDDS